MENFDKNQLTKYDPKMTRRLELMFITNNREQKLIKVAESLFFEIFLKTLFLRNNMQLPKT